MARWSNKYDAVDLAGTLREIFGGKRITEKRMFGGVCFMHRGNLLCGTGGPGYMFRVGKEQHARALKRKGASAVKMKSRSLEGFIWVDPAACGARDLKSWIGLAERYVGKLPAKVRK